MIENLAGVENALGVERLLQGAHQRHFLGRARDQEVRLFLQTDAVFGGHRPADVRQRFVDGALDRFPRGLVLAGANREMQIAVADLAASEVAVCIEGCVQKAVHIADVRLHVRYRQSHIEDE